MEIVFSDRVEAGHRLAKALDEYRGTQSLVLGMARGGVVVGHSVALDLGLPLSALVVRKIGAPFNPELAIGAVSETGAKWIDRDLARVTEADEAYLAAEVRKQMAEAKRRQDEYSSAGVPPNEVRGRTGIIVDDGIATGASALVAIESVRALGAREVLLATPVASPQSITMLRPHVDRMATLATPDPFLAVGMHYVHFDQVSDREVVRLLQDARNSDASRAG